jgi:hypothetical protein
MGLVWWTAALAAMAAGFDTPNAAPADLAWQPRARFISVERVADAPGSAPAGPVLRVRGRIETGWNYALSDHLPIEAGKLYRLSARLRVDRLGPGSPMPYSKAQKRGKMEKMRIAREFAANLRFLST